MPHTLNRFVRVAVTAAVTATMTLAVALPASAATTDPDTIPGAPDFARGLVNIDDVIYFGGGPASNLGTYDGTSFTLYDRPGDPAEVMPAVALGDDILMQADDSNTYGLFWTFDRTTEVFTQWGDTTVGPLIPRDFAVADGVAYFTASNAGFAAQVLWKFDGTTVAQVPGAVMVENVATFNGDVLMSASGVLTVYHPATNTFTPLPTVPNPRDFTEYGGKLYWVAEPGGIPTLYEYNPATDSTRVFDQPGDPVDPESLSVANDRLYLTSYDGSADRMVSFDGSTLTSYPAAPSDPSGFTGFDGKVYFSAAIDGVELLNWYDPTTGTFHSFAAPSEPYGFTVLGDRLIFSVDEDPALWFIQTKALAATGVDAAPGVSIALGLLGVGAAGLVLTLLLRRRSRLQTQQ